mmetsp:Transcript_3061/g.4121  ORF Transcript_3061/g.4121 Transcript_3061/m.4121 type:complete len:275 (+) Transcript_3061:45-869(+)
MNDIKGIMIAFDQKERNETGSLWIQDGHLCIRLPKEYHSLPIRVLGESQSESYEAAPRQGLTGESLSRALSSEQSKLISKTHGNPQSTEISLWDRVARLKENELAGEVIKRDRMLPPINTQQAVKQERTLPSVSKRKFETFSKSSSLVHSMQRDVRPRVSDFGSSRVIRQPDEYESLFMRLKDASNPSVPPLSPQRFRSQLLPSSRIYEGANIVSSTPSLFRTQGTVRAEPRIPTPSPPQRRFRTYKTYVCEHCGKTFTRKHGFPKKNINDFLT